MAPGLCAGLANSAGAHDVANANTGHVPARSGYIVGTHL